MNEQTTPDEIIKYKEQIQTLRVIYAKLLDDGNEYMPRQLQHAIHTFEELIKEYSNKIADDYR